MANVPFTVRAYDDLNNYADRNFEIEVLNTVRERIVIAQVNPAVLTDRQMILMTDNTAAGAVVYNTSSLDGSTTGAVNTQFRMFSAGSYFYALTNMGNSPGGNSRIYRSTDGKVWTNISSTVEATIGNSGKEFCSGVGDGALWALSSIGTLPANNVVKSTDGGDTWSIAGAIPGGYLTNNQATPSNVNGGLTRQEGVALAYNKATGTYIMYAKPTLSSGACNLFRSTDGGASWSLVHTLAGTGQAHPRVIKNAGGVFFCSHNYGTNYPDAEVVISTDDGLTWQDKTAFFVVPQGDDIGLRNIEYINGRWVFVRWREQTGSPITDDCLMYTDDFVTAAPCVGTVDYALNGLGGGQRIPSTIISSQGRIYCMAQNNPSGLNQPFMIMYTEDGVNFFETGITSNPGLANEVLAASFGSAGSGEYGWTSQHCYMRWAAAEE